MTTAKSRSKGRKALGRGLSALISSPPVPVAPTQETPPAETARQDSPEDTSKKTPATPEPAVADIVQFPSPAEEAPAKTRQATPPRNETVETPASDMPATFTDRVRYIPISAISNNPDQPRQIFKDEEIAELASSIKELGILQPALVRPISGSENQYEIVAGERRWRAAQKAGLSQLPVIIRSLADRETLEIAIVENVQRSDLSVLEEARAYQRLIDEFKLNQKEVAQKVGKDRSSIANTLRLLKLPELVQDLLKDSKITTGHAKAILTVKEPKVQLSLAKKVVDEHLSVRALENIVSRVVVLDKPQGPGKEKRKKKIAPGGKSAFPEQVERLRRKLGTKVAIKHHESGRGKIEIDYFSEAELDRILDKIYE